MKEYSITTPDKLEKLCLDNNWLTEVTCSQFTKIFTANEAAVSVYAMTLLIWMCSPNADIVDIKESLTQAHKEYEISEEC